MDLNLKVPVQNFFQSMALERQGSTLIHREAMDILLLLLQDSAGARYQTGFICRPIYTDTVLKTFARLKPISAPKPVDPEKGLVRIATKDGKVINDVIDADVTVDPSVALRENMILREMLWLRHGCSLGALYGDDAEMQCKACGIDFRRDPVQKIFAVFERQARERYRKAVEAEHAAGAGIPVDQAPGNDGRAENGQAHEVGTGVPGGPPGKVQGTAIDHGDLPESVGEDRGDRG